MKIPFHRPHITDSEINAVTECLRNGWLTMGEKTAQFENMFKEYLAIKEAVAVNSCTAALHLALKCIELKPGDEVIIPAMTHTSTAEVIGYFDAKPVMVDIERETHLIDVSKIEAKINSKTKAIIPVHFAGQPADMDDIMTIAKENNLFVIEDAAHALPAKYKEKFIGAIGDITCFSFYATKTITTGEGGLAATKNTDFADFMRLARLHGVTKDSWKRENKNRNWEYDIENIGYKYNTTDINSAIGIEQMKKIDLLNTKRAEIVKKYENAFKNEESIITYTIKPNRETSNHLYPVKINLETLNIDRDLFIEDLKQRNIGTSVHFIPLYRFSYYNNMGYCVEDYPECEWVFKRTLSLPVFPGMTDKEINFVIDNILEITKKNKK